MFPLLISTLLVFKNQTCGGQMHGGKPLRFWDYRLTLALFAEKLIYSRHRGIGHLQEHKPTNQHVDL